MTEAKGDFLFLMWNKVLTLKRRKIKYKNDAAIVSGAS